VIKSKDEKKGVKREEAKKFVKVGMKEVKSKENDLYLNFDYASAVQTPDFFGKHIAEFECEEGELIPNVLTVLFEYFDENPDFYTQQGLF
jgi:hypothetical protein